MMRVHDPIEEVPLKELGESAYSAPSDILAGGVGLD